MGSCEHGCKGGVQHRLNKASSGRLGIGCVKEEYSDLGCTLKPVPGWSYSYILYTCMGVSVAKIAYRVGSMCELMVCRHSKASQLKHTMLRDG